MADDRQGTDVYAEMEARLAEDGPRDAIGVKRDRWVIGVMLFGVALTLPSILGLKGDMVAWGALVGLLLELCGLSVLSYRQVRDVAPGFIDAKRKFAVELDRGFLGYQQTLAWLRTLPPAELDRRLAYAESRLQSITQRYPVVFGAVDKLGLLPLLVGVFVQWQAIDRVSIGVGIFAAFMFALYGMAIWMVRFRLQLQSYVRLLTDAVSGSGVGKGLKDDF